MGVIWFAFSHQPKRAHSPICFPLSTQNMGVLKKHTHTCSLSIACPRASESIGHKELRAIPAARHRPALGTFSRVPVPNTQDIGTFFANGLGTSWWIRHSPLEVMPQRGSSSNCECVRTGWPAHRRAAFCTHLKLSTSAKIGMRGITHAVITWAQRAGAPFHVLKEAR